LRETCSLAGTLNYVTLSRAGVGGLGGFAAVISRRVGRRSQPRAANLPDPFVSCPVEKILFDTWKTAVDLYARTAIELHTTADTLDCPERDRLRRAADEAAARAQVAHRSLNRHRAEHGC
jgi:hypothetical protein